MDPATILAVAGTSARLATTAWGLGQSFYELLKDAKTVDETLVNIATQTRTVKELCLSIVDVLQRFKPRVDFPARLDRTSCDIHATNVVRTIGEQLVNCEKTLECLCRQTQGIRTGNAGSMDNLLSQIKFNMSKDAIAEARTQLSLHLLTLNASLQVLSLDGMTCVHRHCGSPSEQSPDASESRISEVGDRRPEHQGNALQSDSSQPLLEKITTCDKRISKPSSNEGSVMDRKAFSTSKTNENIACDLDMDSNAYGTTQRRFLQENQGRDFADQVSLDLVEGLLEGAVSAYHAEEYSHARHKMFRIIEAIEGLAPALRQEYDVLGLRYMHAVSTYHSANLENARCVLSKFVSDPAATDLQRSCKAHIASLLACVCIDLCDPEAGRLAATTAIQITRSSPILDQPRLDGYLAIHARCEHLLGNSGREKTVRDMIISARRDFLTRYCDRYPHKQGLDLDERRKLVQTEHVLFLNANLCGKSWKVKPPHVRRGLFERLLIKRRFAPGPGCRNYGVTDLHHAALLGDLDAAKELIEAGANVNAEAYVSKLFCLHWDKNNPLTPLACALLLRHLDLARLLAYNGASLMNHKGTSVVTAVANKAFTGNSGYSLREVLDCLRYLGWNINESNSSRGLTLMHHAAQIPDVQLIFTLMSCGASPLLKDDQGNLPIHIAISTGNDDWRLSRVIQALLQQEKDTQLRSLNEKGMSPLHVLTRCRNASEHIALLLLKAGADPYAQDRLGKTPYQWLQRRWDWTGVSKFFIQN